MNADEIVTVIDVLQAAWPWAEWQEKTLALWCDAIQNLDPAVGLATARTVVRKHERPPSIAEFLAEARSETERHRTTVSALPAPDVDPQGRDRFVAMARAAVARQRDVEHWHGGEEPCPVCGGQRPDLRKPRTS